MYVTPCTRMNACMSRYIHVLLVEYNYYLYYYLLCFARLTGFEFTCYLQLPFVCGSHNPCQVTELEKPCPKGEEA